MSYCIIVNSTIAGNLNMKKPVISDRLYWILGEPAATASGGNLAAGEVNRKEASSTVWSRDHFGCGLPANEIQPVAFATG